MTTFYCYILQSQTLDRYYVGSTILNVQDRLERHLSQFYGNKKFTAKANDWVVFMVIECSTIEQARKIESHIKKMKSKKYIRNLKDYPEIIEKLKSIYHRT